MIIHVFAKAIEREEWWICTAILECVEVVLIFVFILVRGDSIPVEVVYVMPGKPVPLDTEVQHFDISNTLYSA